MRANPPGDRDRRPDAPRRRLGRRPVPGPAAALLLALSLAVPLADSAAADDAVVAVAANFAEVAERLEARFERDSGHSLTLVVGSTGKLYAQIANGAPFDAFLAADRERPERLEREGLAVAGSRFTYATGRLTLWSRDPGALDGDPAAALGRRDLGLLAIANPALAPYGEAARQTLRSLGLWESVEGELVLGETVGQAYALVASGNAELGFVALSYVLSPRNRIRGSRWDVPPGLHAPIRQDAVLLARAAGNPAALGFLEFLRGERAGAVIAAYGYAVE